MRRTLAVLLLALAASAQAQRLQPPVQIEAIDTPNDAGGSLTVTWPRWETAPAGITYRVYLAGSATGPFHVAAETAAPALKSADPALFGDRAGNDQQHFVNVTGYDPGEEGQERAKLEDGRTYYLRLGVRTPHGEARGPVVEATPRGNWFNTAKLNNLVLSLGLSIVVLAFIALARRRDLFIRRIAGLEALDEALGRATEMGKSVLFVHGLKGMSDIPTIAAVNILGRVARRTARFGTALRVATNDPIVLSVSQEVVKGAYLEEGRPDAYRPEDVFMAGTDQFSYAAAVEGIMVREKPAAHILMGYFYAESLLLTETGATTGAIQIAGTDAYTQLPFFVTTCDYTLMGEELYAASAYLSKEPKLLGSLKGQDVGKGLLILLLVVGTVLASFHVDFLTRLFASL
ncbi:MAG: DUF6754 domain-containing protein [Gemmatimonadota bacterium]